MAKIKQAKKNDKNQRAYDRMVFMYYKGIRLLVVHQTSKDEYVQYGFQGGHYSQKSRECPVDLF